MRKLLPVLLLIASLILSLQKAFAVFPDSILPPQIGMTEAVGRAAAALEPYLKERSFGKFEDFQPLQANYIWRSGEWIGPGSSVVNEKGIWVVMFAPTVQARVKAYVYILRDGADPVIFVLEH